MKLASAVLLGIPLLAIAACAPPHVHRFWGGALRPVSRLDCPSRQGGLRLQTADAGLTSCAYKGEDGSEVQLTLLPVKGDLDDTLGPVEGQLKALMPAPPPASDAAASTNAGPASDNVNIRLPGLSIHAGDHAANVRVGGVKIDADGSDDNVHVTGGGALGGKGRFSVDATDQGAIIRSQKPGPDVDRSLVLTSDRPGPDGWRLVAYQARGPKAGPLIVATVKSRSQDADSAMDDAKRLVELSAEG